jgi:cobyrinic acid a,c-diamide synthase
MPSAENPAAATRPFSAFVIAGTHSGVGKTSVVLGLIGALRKRGLTVQPFKVGPDFIDPLHHRRASGRRSCNLDGWMLEPEVNRERFVAGAADAEVAIVEGVMGLFDGSDGAGESGSTAEMASLLGLPVVLVVDASAMARSAAAVIHGFTSFRPDLRVSGAILNNVGGEAHAQMIRAAVGERTPILGAIPLTESVAIRERHLGLHLPHELSDERLARLGALVEEHVEVERLLELGRRERPTATTASSASPASPARPRARIAVAHDRAFCFYYEDNLDLLELAGAELVEFSPLEDSLPDDVDGLYLGGGYPELHAAELSENTAGRGSIGELAASGAPVYAECGGLMYLARSLELEDGAHPLCGVLPFATRMPAPLTIDYAEVRTTGGLFGPGHTARGHAFHRSAIVGGEPADCCYEVHTSRGEQRREGYSFGNVLASYVHLHFASAPALAPAFVRRCVEHRSRMAC